MKLKYKVYLRENVIANGLEKKTDGLLVNSLTISFSPRVVVVTAAIKCRSIQLTSRGKKRCRHSANFFNIWNVTIARKKVKQELLYAYHLHHSLIINLCMFDHEKKNEIKSVWKPFTLHVIHLVERERTFMLWLKDKI